MGSGGDIRSKTHPPTACVAEAHDGLRLDTQRLRDKCGRGAKRAAADGIIRPVKAQQAPIGQFVVCVKNAGRLLLPDLRWYAAIAAAVVSLIHVQVTHIGGKLSGKPRARKHSKPTAAWHHSPHCCLKPDSRFTISDQNLTIPLPLFSHLEWDRCCDQVRLRFRHRLSLPT